ncbi:MAG: DM13 domain-containing protein, partial [Hyphomicrobiales bacterium]|nr:DM13 domain-containing protein [Hyphomicrobiales bacterium]
FLEPDFKVGPGPKYHVYLVPKAMIRASGEVVDTMYVDLGQLRAFEGSQRYPIPDGVDLAGFPSVVIWCEAFSVLISPADLQAPESTSQFDSDGSNGRLTFVDRRLKHNDIPRLTSHGEG